MVTLAGESQPPVSGGEVSAPGARPMLTDVVARTAGRLATALAGLLTQAVLDLHEGVADEVFLLHDSVNRQKEEFAAAAHQLANLTERTNSLAATVFEQGSAATQERYEKLAADVASLQETGARQESAWALVRQETERLSRSVFDHIDAILTRLERQEHAFAAFSLPISETSSKVDALVQRLEAQAEVVRLLYDAQVQWTDAVDEVMEILSGARSASARFFEMAGGRR